VRASYLLPLILLAVSGSCQFETGPSDDGITGDYFLQSVNDQVLPRWPGTLRVVSSDGPLEIVSPGSIKLRSNGTFVQELTTVERPGGASLRTVTHLGSGTFRRLDDGSVEFSGGPGGTFTGRLGPGSGSTLRVLEIDRRSYDGLTYRYWMLRDLHFR
jgi:hypothetical protein